MKQKGKRHHVLEGSLCTNWTAGFGLWRSLLGLLTDFVFKSASDNNCVRLRPETKKNLRHSLESGRNMHPFSAALTPVESVKKWGWSS